MISVFSGLKILFKNEWVKDYAVVVEDNIIKSVLPYHMLKDLQHEKHYEFPHDYFLIPGLIDLHIHGINGFDVMDGNIQALQGMSSALVAEGVTGFLATTMSANRERMTTVLNAITAAMPETNGAEILGIHLEGPFIAQEKMGAQQSNAIEKPDAALIAHWLELSNETIKLVTLAPELAQAELLIKILRDKEVVVSIGHTNASYAETLNALSLGCSHATHLFNAMSGLHQREPGAVGALLLSNAVSAEVIADGLHLHPAILDLTLRLKGYDNVVLVTDAMRAKCLGDGEYDLGGQTVVVNANKARLKNGVLAGSVLSMPQAIKNMVQFTQCSLMQAINMATVNPARILGLTNKKGCIDKDKDADMVVMNADFETVMTMKAGKVVYNAR